MAAKWKRLYIGIPEGYIKPEGTVELVAQGEADVTSYATANVNIPSYDGTMEALSGYTVTLIAASDTYTNAGSDYSIDGGESWVTVTQAITEIHNVTSIMFRRTIGEFLKIGSNEGESDIALLGQGEEYTLGLGADNTIYLKEHMAGSGGNS